MGSPTSYESSMVKAYPGLIYDEQPHTIVSRFIDGGSDTIPAGAPVSRVTDKVTLGGAGAAFGVAVRDLVEGENISLVGNDVEYKASPGDIVPIMVRGWIWVEIVSGTGVSGDAVAYNDVTGEWVLGTPGVGESSFDRATLQNSITGAGQMALIRLRGNEN